MCHFGLIVDPLSSSSNHLLLITIPLNAKYNLEFRNLVKFLALHKLDSQFAIPYALSRCFHQIRKSRSKLCGFYTVKLINVLKAYVSKVNQTKPYH